MIGLPGFSYALCVFFRPMLPCELQPLGAEDRANLVIMPLAIRHEELYGSEEEHRGGKLQAFDLREERMDDAAKGVPDHLQRIKEGDFEMRPIRLSLPRRLRMRGRE